MQIIQSIAELDTKIAECNQADLISDEGLRAVFPTFRMDVPPGFPEDPFSLGYREAQLALYRDIAGAAYSTDREATKFDVGSAAVLPFPYSTGSTAVAAPHGTISRYQHQHKLLYNPSRLLERIRSETAGRERWRWSFSA